jgi:Putative transposase
MTPMEFMARLSALIPRPKIPLVRYHGIFASRSSWRPLVTPKPPAQAATPKSCAALPSASTPTAQSPAPAPVPPTPASPAPESLAVASPMTAAPVAAPAPAPAGLSIATVAGEPVAAEPVVVVEPTMISVAHWGRLGHGELFARARYVEWAVMMKRSWGFNVLTCPRCSGKLRVLATITQPDVIRKILEHLDVRSSPLPRAPARDPDWEQMDLGFEAA